MYALEGRPSVPPEQLLLASLLQAFYGIRSERLLLEQLHYNLLFRWFVGLSPDDAIWHPTTFTKNRDRLLNDDVMGLFLEKLMGAPEVKPLLSDDHFSVDGTLLQAWASHASLKRIDGQEDPPPPPTGPGEGFGAPKEGKKRAKGDFRGIKLSNETHRSSTDPEALLARKSNAHPAQLSYRGHVLMDNRHDLIVDCRVTQATGTGKRDAAQAMAAGLAGAHQKTLAADKNDDTKGLVAEMRRIGVTPHRIRPARDRLQPDPPGQPAQALDGGGMNNHLPRDGSRAAQSKPSRQANHAEIGPFVDLKGADPSL